jgi:hypothetical protein
MRLSILAIWLVMAALLAGAGCPAGIHAQDWTPTVIEEPGICDGAICGPSGGFTVETFPTIIDIDWAAFPANPLRPHVPTGQTIYVATSGSDDNPGSQNAPLATLDRALETAQTGDVIQVADGVYPVGRYDDSLIMATPGVTLMAENVGGAVLEPLSDDWLWLAAIDARADDLVIDGFVIRGFTRGYGLLFGRADSPQRNLVLRHLWIENVGDGLRSAFPESDQAVVDGMLVYDVALRDALIGFNCGEGPCNNVRLEALSIDLMTSTDVDTDSWGDGVAFEAGDNVVVFNAAVTAVGADGLDFKAERVAVANVIVHDVQRNGIKFWHDGDIINALVYNTGADAALVFDTGAACRIVNSTIARHAVGQRAYAGTVAYDHPAEAGSLAILNSVFYENSGALWVSGAFDLNVRKTLFYGAANGQELIWATTPALTIGQGAYPIVRLETAGGGCCGLPFTAPGFVDPDGGDYTLAPMAFGRDKGLSRPDDLLPPFDLLGNPRIHGPFVDLGPYEMQE